MPPEKNVLSVLVIEDNPADFCLIETMLESSSLPVKEILSATRIAEACALLQEKRIHLVFLDLSLPDSFGIDSFLQLKSFVQHIPVIILTGLSGSPVALEALQLGAQDYLVKGEFGTALLEKSAGYSIERKKAEEKIITSEKNYRQMFDKNPFPAWIYNMETMQFLEVNDAAIQKYGYPKEEFLTLTIEDIRPPETVGRLRRSVEERSEDYKWQKKIWKHKSKEGETMLMEVTFYQINYFGQTAMQAQMNDITEKLRLERELALEQKQRQQQIAGIILKTQEEEKKLLGSELHDNINQILATANLYINSGLKGQGDMNDLVTKGQDCIIMAIEEIRKLSKVLVAPVLISNNLKGAVEGLATDIGALKGMAISVNMETLDTMVLTDIQKITVYRIVQEQLNNIVKYAEASAVQIQIEVYRENIVLTITDNGKGFDTAAARKGVGLVNIQNRAELFNGKSVISSSPGNGCCLKVELNIENNSPQVAA